VTESAPQSLLRETVELLDSIGIPYMVVGSFASTAHGEPRSTQDLDLVIDPTPTQLDKLVAGFDMERFYLDEDVARDALRRRSMFNIIEIATAWKLDLMIRKARAFSIEELNRRQRMSILGIEVAAATPEDTIIAKLEWAKQGASDRQLDDVAGIIRVRGAQLDVAYIERWLTELDLGDQWERARGVIR
jgi:hypothetical protein